MLQQTNSVTGSGSVMDQLSSQYSPITVKNKPNHIEESQKKKSDSPKNYPVIEIKADEN